VDIDTLELAIAKFEDEGKTAMLLAVNNVMEA
jgi:hypothetical protein